MRVSMVKSRPLPKLTAMFLGLSMMLLGSYSYFVITPVDDILCFNAPLMAYVGLGRRRGLSFAVSE